MSEELRKVLESVPAEDFAKIIPQRRAIIEKAQLVLGEDYKIPLLN